MSNVVNLVRTIKSIYEEKNKEQLIQLLLLKNDIKIY